MEKYLVPKELMAQQGTLYTKDKTSKLEYQKKGNDYVFKVYDVDYTRNQYKKRGDNEAIMTYNQFINYLYAELYIEEETYKKWMPKEQVEAMQDFFSSENEVELTNELIEQLVKDKKWGDVKSLQEMRDMGAKWNIKRNSLIF